MTFEEDFPSLKDYLCPYCRKLHDSQFTDLKVQNLIQDYCLDKQKVKEAIDKIIPMDENCATNMILNNSLKKKMRLE